MAALTESVTAMNVTALGVCHPFVFSGTGSTLAVYDLGSGDLVASRSVFFGGVTIHGVCVGTSPDTPILAFGQRCAALVRLQRAEEGYTIEMVHDFGWFRDLVWDARLIFSENGAASHAVFALSLGYVQVWDLNRKEMVSETLCDARCINYSMSFHPVLGNANELWIACGTVFNKVLVWKAELGDTTPVQQTLLGHTGAIFRVKWSHNGRLLCSVSDDRTVKLWGTASANIESVATAPISGNVPEFSLLWSSYGHRSRIWDCAFWERGVVSVGEDCMARVWDWQGNCLVALEGHAGRSCWRCVVDPTCNVLVTGGSDASIKLWDLERSTAFSTATSVPGAADETKRKKKLTGSSEKKPLIGQSALLPSLPSDHVVERNPSQYDSISAVELAKDGSMAVAAALQGKVNRIWRLSLHDAAQASYADSDWELVYNSEDHAGHEMRGGFGCLRLSPCGKWIAVGDKTGALLVVSSSFKEDKQAFYFKSLHSMRIVLLTWVNATTLYSAAADGTIRKTVVDKPEGETQATVRTDNGGQITYALASKRGVSRSVMVYRVPGLGELLLSGDTRGGIHVFTMGHGKHPNDRVADDSVQSPHQTPCHVSRVLHGRDKVTSLIAHGGKLYSTGHNGTIAEVHVMVDENVACDCTNCETLGKHPRVYLRCGRVIKTGPVNSVEKLIFQSGSMIVCGFQSSDLMVWDVTKSYMILRLSCGGWKRPYSVHLPEGADESIHSSFRVVYAPPHNKKSVSLQVASFVQAAPRFEQYALGQQSHGRSAWTTMWVPTKASSIAGGHPAQFLVSGGEDNTLKIFHYKRKSTSTPTLFDGATKPDFPTDCASWGRSVELNARTSELRCLATLDGHETSVRSIAMCPLGGGGAEHERFLMVSAGGKEILRAWLLDVVGGANSPHVDANLICERRVEDTDDKQRILAVAAYPSRGTASSLDEGGENHVVVVSNSEGELLVLGLQFALHQDSSRVAFPEDLVSVGDEMGKRIKRRGVIRSGKHGQQLVNAGLFTNIAKLQKGDGTNKPILCLDTVVVTCQQQRILVSGGTDGRVSVWNLSRLLDGCVVGADRMQEDSGENDGGDFLVDDLAKTAPVFKYQGHEMGVNCCKTAKYRGSEDSFVVVTGGDDQAFTVGVVHCSLVEGELNMELASVVRVSNADGSSLRGVFTDGMTACSVGLNQRLRVWQLFGENDDVHLGSSDQVAVGSVDKESGEVVSNGTNTGIKLLYACPVDVTDVNAMHVHAGSVAIVGAGVQVFT